VPILRACSSYGFDPEIDDMPWSDDGKSPTFVFCHCCGVEFGYHDSSVDAMRRHRRQWVDGGHLWFDPELRPVDWDPATQLAQLPDRVV
jgi:hypothetical protein